ncbi:MAG: glycosyltransferase family 2 protein [Cryomorphaceae bacterium]
MNTPLVSIITPAFNNADTLEEAASSVFAQRYENWEWIVVNNGSTDHSHEVLQQWENHPRIKTLHASENLGASGGRNAGLDLASGDFICFLDADDRLPEESLSARMNVMLERPEVAFVDGAVRRIDVDGNEIETRRPDFNGSAFSELLSLSGRCFIGITWLIRKSPGEAYRFHTGVSHGEDLLFFLSIAHLGLYTHVEESIYDYRFREQSAMRDLLGLEKGYTAIEKEIKTWPNVSIEQAKQFHASWRTIMIKSYLKAGKLSDALRLKLL